MGRRSVSILIGCTLLVTATFAVTVPSAPAHEGHEVAAHEAPSLPAGFQDRTVIAGISEPIAVAFAPDGTAFVALKTGVIKSWDYNSSTEDYEPNATHTDFANLDVNVNNYWDRGLTGITLDPQFGTAGHNFVYVIYSYNRDPRDAIPVVPKWGTPGQQYDECPAPASMGPPAVPGCLINVRVSRLTGTVGANGWVMTGAELPLLEGACMQFPSHASGDVRIGPDGYLYASAGDGASFDTEDYGQAGNPCPGDPVNEGGSLRSQDIRTSGDALGFSGSIVRMNPATGLAPNGSSNNADRIVLHGQRNPWRFTFRPGTSELWSADVGGSNWEEINRTDMATFSGPGNLGWPCYEGAPSGSTRNAAWDALDKPLCESLYGAGPAAVRAPYFGYRTRGSLLTPGEDCEDTTSSISGLAFTGGGANYPAAYRNSLYFSDYARRCVWRLGRKANGDPDPQTIVPFVQQASTPVDLVTGPDGDLFYVDYGLDEAGVPTPQAGGIHRIGYGDPAPVAEIGADHISGPLSQVYHFTAAGSTDPQGGTLSYAWDLDGDGAFDDAAGLTAERQYASPVNVLVTVRATSSVSGKSGTASLMIYPGNSPPVIGSMTPGTQQRWRVGQHVPFSASATDPDDGALGDESFNWVLSVRHCPDTCHTHPVHQWLFQRSGSLTAPDHEFPSHLLLTLFVTDSRGMRVRKTVRLDPRSVLVSHRTKPDRLKLTVAGRYRRASIEQRFIVGSRYIVAAPAQQRRQGVTYAFRRWSDRGARVHMVSAPATTAKLKAKYAAIATTLRIGTSPVRLRVRVDGRARKDGWKGTFGIGETAWVKAPWVQTRNGERWLFVGWSDGRPPVHKITLSGQRVDLEAVYRRA